MAEITAALVKELREKTGAGMMDCKKALTETDGDLEGAVDWLRTKGLAAAAKKAGRAASEGLVGVAVDGANGAIVEINAETDFVARNDTFQGFVGSVANIALEAGSDLNALNSAAMPDSDRNVGEELTHLISTIGENMTMRRAATISVTKGALASYVHSAISPGLGKIGVLVGLESDADADKLSEVGKQIAMHIAAAKPLSVSQDDLDPEELEREKSILAEQARDSGKPENIIEKMVEGRLRKYYEEVCLLDQVFVIDGETKISDVLAKAGNDLGAPVSVSGFALFVLGEGVEKKEEDFAAEVAAAAAG
ncbi:MAG: elongation factor Ts [Rhodospirillaceae bacterium]|nr:elongation factor Ts [Rhodospirillaceae bacterium]MBT6085982.1 elongation factor Ts [Rhodospirillaceae bacterium]MBT6608368.1 elongation factor Ts [Rhodospirillaceae bacterium]MBT6885251.1 elongation factor Ts [Rhodospirillaceae bacterium]MBT7248843.1 elongation factor Ts [Rhodospirillaceae bacterium]